MSVFTRKGSPFYYCEFQIQGTRILRSTGCRTEREARAAEKRLRAEFKTKLDADKGQKAGAVLTLDQAFGKYWLEHANALAPTWRSEVKRYCAHILSLVPPDLPIDQISEAEVSEFVQAHNAAGGGAYALNRAISIWRRVHRLAKKRWRQQTIEIDWSDFRNAESLRVRHLTVQEAQLLISFAPASLAPAIEWSLLTGSRRNETFSLTWDSIDLQAAKATVKAKGGREHTLWLNPDALALLAKIERHGRYVFDKTGWRKKWEAAVKKANLADFRWHDLRHTHCTMLRQAGVPLEIVQRSAGHADLQTTMRYAHVADHEVRDALTKLPSFSLGGDSKVVSIRKGRKT
jgi:integrase